MCIKVTLHSRLAVALLFYKEIKADIRKGQEEEER
jgi:hypothetical protein